MRVAVGGTFNVLHRGHRALLSKAFELGDEVAIGLTSDSFVKANKPRDIPLESRRKALEDFASKFGKKFDIFIIDNAQGTLLEDARIDTLVVSQEKLAEAQGILKQRLDGGLRPIRIVRIPYILADDCTPISSSRILNGEIDEEGRLLRTLKVGVGSDNPIKLTAVESVMRSVYGDVEVIGRKVATSVPSEPCGDEVERGAIDRARASLTENDLGVGIEAGIFEHRGALYDVQFCAIVDNMDRITLGHGSGFQYPPAVIELLRKGSTVGHAFQDLYDQERTGRGSGAIGFLTHGLLKRSELTQQAVVAAMVPRMRKELYLEV